MNLEVICFSAKILGAVFVIAGCVGTGFYKSHEITERIEMLKELYRLFLLLKNEINYLAQPVPEALAAAAGRCSGIYRDFFEETEHLLYTKKGSSFSEIWQQCVRKYFAGSCLKPEDLQLICNIGDNMGFMDMKTQISAMTLYLENMKASIQYLTDTAQARQRVYKCIGAFSGFLAVILLI